MPQDQQRSGPQPEQTFVLITGGSGFVGVHCLVQLLEQGYRVRTTLRSLKKREQVLDMLNPAGIQDFSHLSFAEADLSSDQGWAEAVVGCDYVLHVASSIFLKLPDHEDEMIRPAVEGAVRVLKAARDAGVKRVVMTSNFGAVGYSHTDRQTLITESSWTDPNQPGLSAYNKSKVLAEKAAWDFIQQSQREGNKMELTVINPMGIFGPSLSPVLSSGFELLRNVLNGSMKRIPDMRMGIVDVRDVADLHLRAMTHPEAAGERFLALAGGTMSLLEIVALVKRHQPQAAAKASTKSMPTWILRLASFFNPQAKAVLPLVGIYREASNAKARSMLGWNPRSNQEAILATVDSLIRDGAL